MRPGGSYLNRFLAFFRVNRQLILVRFWLAFRFHALVSRFSVAAGTPFTFSVAGTPATPVSVAAGLAPAGSCGTPLMVPAGTAIITETLPTGTALTSVSTL